jgi:hemoglobin-like flavoprotein
MSNTAQIEQRLRYLGIDDVVIDDLLSAREILEPKLDQMLDIFYARIMDEPELKDLFPDDQSMARARQAQKTHWLESLLVGDFTDDYCERAERIGHAHARAGVTPNWYIGGYSNMLTQFVQHVVARTSEDDYSAGPIIEALCKAVFLDLDFVMHSYLEAKDRVIFDLLLQATRFIDTLTEANEELRAASEKVRESAESLAEGSVNGSDKTETVQQMLDHANALTTELGQIRERIDELKTGKQLYLQSGSEHTGTFAQIVSRTIDV